MKKNNRQFGALDKFVCDKRLFKTQKEAYEDILMLPKKRFFQYYCSVCKGYHNTHRKARPEKKYITKLNPSLIDYRIGKEKLKVGPRVIHENWNKLQKQRRKKYQQPLKRKNYKGLNLDLVHDDLLL